MEQKYVIDTNIMSVHLQGINPVLEAYISQYRRENLILPELVIYEIERGLKYRDSKNLLARFRNQFIPMFDVITPILEDWRTAGDLWVLARRKGRQLSDMDLAIAAIALRFDAILITNDQDFSGIPFPLQIQDWTILL
jgi:predicted nucleic acid-binding protein